MIADTENKDNEKKNNGIKDRENRNTAVQKPDPMKLAATGIVNARFIIIAVFALACVYCVL